MKEVNNMGFLVPLVFVIIVIWAGIEQFDDGE